MYTQTYISQHRFSTFRDRSHRLVILLAVIVLVGMSGLFLAHTNAIATDSFSLQQQEGRRSDLEQQISRLRIQIASEQSLKKIGTIVKDKNMVAIGTPLFVNRENSLAVNF
ncbi:MAG: hypothetical protein NTZ80_03055 [Patescibacteria group bacterium]|nr:hypothetical protein [Patescibacteria group bacterium]